nr:RNA-dependent RNA polymerase [Tombusviridae sp.]
MASCELPYYKKFMDYDTYAQCDALHKNLIVSNVYGKFVSRNGIRASGDGDTSLGNTITNCMLTAFCFDIIGCEWTGLFEGDDSLFAWNGVDPARVQFVFEAVTNVLGYELKFEQKKDLLTSHFLSTFYGTKASWSDPITVMQRLNASFRAVYDPRKAPGLFNSKYLSAWFNNKNTPVIAPLCLQMYDKRVPVQLDFDQLDAYHKHHLDRMNEFVKLNGMHNDIDIQTRIEYAITTGIDVPLQYYLEQGFEKFSYTHSELIEPVIDYDIDEMVHDEVDVVHCPIELITPEQYKFVSTLWHARL